jgi:NodT family efflux transporter outer membrane factor (OMF) lipoprotein
VPTQDKQYLVAFAQLPDAASLDRTEAVIRKMSDIALKHPGVEASVAFPGLSINGFTVSPNSGIVFVILKPFGERHDAKLSGFAITEALNAEFAQMQDAFIAIFPPPPVNGLGTIDGFKLHLQDRADAGYEALYAASQELTQKAWQTPGLTRVFSSYQINVPQLDAEVDRVKAKSQGVPLANVFETMQIYLGSLYVNDFNRFGRTYQVIAQAEAQFRDRSEDITRLKTRNAKGQIVPLGALVKVKETYGPDRVMHYNGYPSADLNGAPAPGYSSGQAEGIMAKLALETLPQGIAFEWTDLTYQKILAGNTAYVIFPLCILLVFLVLAAQYESLRLPLAIILIVPMCLLFAIAGVWLSKGDNNIFTQIGFIVLIGLACKNAILIVEFARAKHEAGMSIVDAALEACRLRLRPILMTSIAFIAGVFPLVTSTGAGAEMRRAMGTAVFSGMIGVTLFGLFLTPIFYVVLMKLGRKKSLAPEPQPQGHALGSQGIATGTAAFLLLSAVMGANAAVGPNYIRPTNVVPATYKSTNDLGTWKEAKPLDNVAKGNWWEVFGEAALNDLEQQATTANQDIKAAVARVHQARATARVARSELLPSLDLDPSWQRERFSPNQVPSFGDVTANAFRAPLDLSYEIDLWGRVRRSFESARAEAVASIASFHNILLTLQGDVAQNYFALRALDAEIATVASTVGLRNEQVQLVRSRFEGGIGNELDVARAETELASTEAEASSLAKRRGELENALAILVGANPAAFKLAQLDPVNANWNPRPPAIPAGLPADLLERRPDVAEAERQLAAANARIGVAKAAFFPVLRLTGSGGFLSADIDSLFNWESRVWSIGPSLSLPIFAGGRNRANYKRSQAAFDEAIAKYRQRILVAFGEVENSLAGIYHLANQADAQNRAAASARRSAQLASDRYRAGIVSYLEVVDANRAALQIERGNAQLTGQRLITTVQLIKALGGGWQESVLTQRYVRSSGLD